MNRPVDCKVYSHARMVVSEDAHRGNSKAAPRTSEKKKYMKRQRRSDASSTVLLSSPAGGRRGSDQGDDVQKASACVEGAGVRPGDAQENGARWEAGGGTRQVTGRGDVAGGKTSDAGLLNGKDLVTDTERRNATKETNNSVSSSHVDPTSPPCSGGRDNDDTSTDPHDRDGLTETSTMTLVDSHTPNTDRSAETHSLLGEDTAHVKEWVLIDDDDDGDMSLREKTVTDMSIMDGNAADLVCGRLLSISSSSSSSLDCKEESPAPETPPADTEAPAKKQHCCYCTVL